MSDTTAKASAPPPEREILWKDVGTWSAEVEVYAGPTPSFSKGRMVSKKGCGDTWLISEYASTDGGTFQGNGMWTWDATNHKYVGVWADNMMQFLAPGVGRWDAATQTMTFVYEATLGDKHMKWRQTTQSVDANTRVFLSFVPDTADKPMMKVTYRRA